MKTTSLVVRKVQQETAKKPLFKFANKGPKKGCFPVDVVTEAGEVARYELSMEFLKMTCFKELLEKYDEPIKWQGSGAIRLPCGVHEFEIAIHKDRISSRLIKN